MGAGHIWRRRWVLCLLGCCLTVLAGGCGLVNRATDWIGLGKPETTPEFKAPISTRVSTATPTPSPSMTLESSSETSEATATRVSATRLPTATRTATVTPTPTLSLLMGPAATLVEVSRLVLPEMLVEIEADAWLGGEGAAGGEEH